MKPRGLYAFESIDETLAYLPLAARRALDAAGLKLSLEGWRSLPIERRWAVVDAGVDAVASSEVSVALREARPGAVATARVAEPSATAAPAVLRDALGAGRPLDDELWSSIGALDRYALLKSAARADKLERAYDEIVGAVGLTHLAPNGDARMVDVASKTATLRQALASARVRTTPRIARAVAARQSPELPKGDVLAAARIAGLLALKRTPELIPLCHPVQTTSATIDFDVDVVLGEVRVQATVAAFDRTGVEMEAMVAASVASLTLYDMIKGADRWARIESIQLEAKNGGKSGPVRRPSPTSAEAPSGAIRTPDNGPASNVTSEPPDAANGTSGPTAAPSGTTGASGP